MIKKIIVNQLNKLRWLYPNQSFVDNILRPKTEEEFNKVVEILTKNNISYTIK